MQALFIPHKTFTWMAAQCSVRGNRTVSHHNVVTTNRRSILAHRRRTHRWQQVITFITDWLFLITRSNWNWLKAAVIKVHVFVRRLANILLPLYTISSAGSWTCWPSSSVPLCWAGYAIAFTNCGRLFLLLKNNTLWNQLMSSLFKCIIWDNLYVVNVHKTIQDQASFQEVVAFNND